LEDKSINENKAYSDETRIKEKDKTTEKKDEKRDDKVKFSLPQKTILD